MSRVQQAFEIHRAEVIPASQSKMLVFNSAGSGWVVDFHAASVFIAGRSSGVATLEEVCRLIVDHRCTVDLLLDDIERHKVRVAGFAVLE